MNVAFRSAKAGFFAFRGAKGDTAVCPGCLFRPPGLSCLR